MAHARYRERMSRSDPRLYLSAEGETFTQGCEISLAPGQAHYLGNVMRHSVGDAVRVFNGRDGEWSARIHTLRKDRGSVVLRNLERPQCATQGVELLFAPLKRDATELVIRMGTELGVTSFRPVVTERTNTHRLNADRLLLIAEEAAEQCERLDVPHIQPLSPLRQVLAEWPEGRALCVALERQQEETRTVSGEALLIGPEGGFSEAEVALLKRHPAVRSISLGSLILKAETAVCAGLVRLAVARGF
ncbi:16S rRNA (uracil(1498)-N(3))-methyltransferase [Gluconobacter wancherniae]|uniref:16S rRNA (uracil(1498)-N(3))-methyltransferase n=1 Tax=Gluconobacter wancherniae TaxID=1307955 RepID=UPI0011BF3511|nr:16S rRNA (uracil(1498)-N(3))-methyltransferase [Gluconobacter wancherniae]MBF0853023.1 16S rRNA (uracil(1498)-N(3))-methyltransferase [Gluconobacter wancherniae]GBD56260.1 ribosomal RNA small subunit methyltransferase E [Gluconobacter wancherniae NBRC 103581]